MRGFQLLVQSLNNNAKFVLTNACDINYHWPSRPFSQGNLSTKIIPLSFSQMDFFITIIK